MGTPTSSVSAERLPYLGRRSILLGHTHLAEAHGRSQDLINGKLDAAKVNIHPVARGIDRAGGVDGPWRCNADITDDSVATPGKPPGVLDESLTRKRVCRPLLRCSTSPWT